jgi:hypothetical protein
MKIGKTIIQIYAGLSMLMAALVLLFVLGIGAMGGGILGAGLISVESLLGFGMIIVAAIMLVEIYISWSLFNFKDWARKVWTVMTIIGLLLSFNIVSLLISGFIGYLMWVDKDTAKAFR